MWQHQNPSSQMIPNDDGENVTGEPDTLMREVYCILGLPIDAIEMPAVLRQIKAAASAAAPFLLSTPNLNFLIRCQDNPIFRESLLGSDLCPPDGFPIIWIARMIGSPIKNRVAGSDIFEALKTECSPTNPLKVFLFGGDEGVAAKASSELNSEHGGLHCVGTLYPGFGTVEEMSQEGLIEAINSSRADFLVASLSAEKGQRWLLRNHHQIRIPIRAHLGAVVNFQAWSLRRAPPIMRRYGLEWLWRIKEEPYLWRRYWKDGRALLGLLLTCVLPLAIITRSQRLRYDRKGKDLLVKQVDGSESVILSLYGEAIASQAEKAVPFFREAVAMKKHIVIDFSATRAIDTRFLGLLFMLRKCLKEQSASLTLTGVSFRLERMIRLNGAGFLLDQAN
jgi:N-acetylglucosaminyldiphosphoundecaprenol N-acetyl-beta-D-mannosaminyltransferase